MPEHHGGRKDHGTGISPVGSHDITSHMPAARLEKRVLLNVCQYFGAEMACGTYRSDVASWNDTRSTDQSGTNVGNDGTIQVRHDHDIELLGLSDQLHRTEEIGVNAVTRGVITLELTCYQRSCR